MSRNPGRNEPCPCGSGKKFKKCCGFDLSHEVGDLISPVPEEMKTGTKFDLYLEMFHGVALYAEMLKRSKQFSETLSGIASDFEKRYKPGTKRGLNDSFFMGWFALDNRFGVDQRTVVERMMDRSIVKELVPEVREIILALSESYATCYEIRGVKEDAIIFEELATGRAWNVHRLGEPCEEDAEPGQIWHVRFVGPDTDAYYFGEPYVFGPEAKPDFTEITKEQISGFREYASTRSLEFKIPRDAFKASAAFWAEYLHRSSGGVPEQSLEENLPGSGPEIVTTDGEKLRFSSVIFKITDLDGISGKLSRLRNLDYDEKDRCWIWFKKGNRRMKSWETTLLGRIFLRGNELVGEVNSLERALRLKSKLVSGLGKQVQFDRIDSKDSRAMPPLSEKDRLGFEEKQRLLHADPEVREMLRQKMEEYYLKDWITSKIPALDHRTPMQCMKTPDGRLRLEALVNQMENMDRGRPDYIPEFDMNQLRQKLGLSLAIRGKDK